MRYPAAIIHPGSRLADNVEVGVYSLIGEHVEIGANTVFGPHVEVEGRIHIGRDK